jgi:hypothetical protein
MAHQMTGYDPTEAAHAAIANSSIGAKLDRAKYTLSFIDRIKVTFGFAIGRGVTEDIQVNVGVSGVSIKNSIGQGNAASLYFTTQLDMIEDGQSGLLEASANAGNGLLGGGMTVGLDENFRPKSFSVNGGILLGERGYSISPSAHVFEQTLFKGISPRDIKISPWMFGIRSQ